MRTRIDATRQSSAVSRFFRSPKSGKVVIVQMPNIPLWVFLAVTATRLLLHPDGALGTIVSVVGTVSLVAWAGLEIIRGESPFRRVLGALVLIALVIGWVVH